MFVLNKKRRKADVDKLERVGQEDSHKVNPRIVQKTISRSVEGLKSTNIQVQTIPWWHDRNYLR